MFDTHCHLNFSAFKKNLDEVISEAKKAGIYKIVVPGTDVRRSRRAVDIAGKYDHIYAAVGIHPHHVFNYLDEDKHADSDIDLKEIDVILKNPKVVAVGEVGMDRHVYQQTKYELYKVDDSFIDLQKDIFRRQIRLAKEHKKSLVIHNRESKVDLLEVLLDEWDKSLEYHTVFHCCEPDRELFDFAMKHHIYLGVDGDITYYKEKQQFWKEITNNGKDLSLLVLETDSPFLLPEPYRGQRMFPNKPERIKDIATFIANYLSVSESDLIKHSMTNADKLFSL